MVVTYKEGRRAQRRRLPGHLHLKPQLPARAYQRREARQKRHEAAAPELVLPGLAVFEQLRIEAQTGIDQKDAAVDLTHLHGGHPGPKQGGRGRAGVLRNTVDTAKIIERALGQHTERTAAAQDSAGHRIDSAIAARRNHHAAALCGELHRATADLAHLRGIVDLQKLERPACGFKNLRHDLPLVVGIVVARSRIHDDEQGADARGSFSQLQGNGHA